MSGCKSCSSCSTQPVFTPAGKAEKLQKSAKSTNPRYPHVLVGEQAIYSDADAQMIVTVVSDDCDDCADCFTLKPERILKDTCARHEVGHTFDASQHPGANRWKLHALI